MKVKIKKNESNAIIATLDNVEKIFKIPSNLTMCEELKNSILIIHKTNHCEKYRLYKDVEVLNVEEEF